jgi:GNAT superfamily N-acetyltransferase
MSAKSSRHCRAGARRTGRRVAVRALTAGAGRRCTTGSACGRSCSSGKGLGVRWAREDGYVVDDNPDSINRDRLYVWLTTDAYWWEGGLSREVLEAALDESLSLSILAPDRNFVGFGRMVTDRATFAYWCDVYVDPAHRRRGLGGWLTALAVSHPDIRTCRRIMLATRDAHPVYARHGFSVLAQPDIFMEINRPGVAVTPP